MKTYRVERVNTENFIKMMRGDYLFDVEYLDIEAETAEEAVNKARKNGYEVINKGNVKTLEELEEERRAENEEIANAAKKRADAAAKRKATEQKKAEELGMTLEEYRADKWRKGEIKRLKKIIADAEEELKKLGE